MIIKYTCTQCGLEVRAEEGVPHKACGCKAPQTEEPEAEE